MVTKVLGVDPAMNFVLLRCNCSTNTDPIELLSFLFVSTNIVLQDKTKSRTIGYEFLIHHVFEISRGSARGVSLGQDFQNMVCHVGTS